MIRDVSIALSTHIIIEKLFLNYVCLFASVHYIAGRDVISNPDSLSRALESSNC